MIDKGLSKEFSDFFKELQKKDPSLYEFRRELYERFQIFWKNVKPRSAITQFLLMEYIQYKEIIHRDKRFDLLLDSTMELFNDALKKNKEQTLKIFAHDLGATPYFENFWVIMGDDRSWRKSDDIRLKIRKMLSLYKEASEGLLKYVAPYVIGCLDIVEKRNLDFERICSYDLGKLIHKMHNEKFPAFELLTKTQTGMSINSIRNVSAHSSIRVFSKNQIELTFRKGKEKICQLVKEEDIDKDIQSLFDIVFMIKFSRALFMADNLDELKGKFVHRTEDWQPEDAFMFAMDTFTKFQYSLDKVPEISDSILNVQVTSILDKDWKEILAELAIHLPILSGYIEMTNNQENVSAIRVIGKNTKGKEVGYVELSVDLINKDKIKEIPEYNLIKQIKFYDSKNKKLGSYFNKQSLKIIKTEEKKINEFKSKGML